MKAVSSRSRNWAAQFAPQKVANRARNFLSMCFKREVTGVVKMHFCSRIVPFEGLGTGSQEEGIAVAPDS